MPELNATLDAIGTELAGLLVDATPSHVDMTLDQFVDYCREQIDFAKADTDPSARITALAELVNLAKAHGWEDTDTMSVSVFSGELAVTSQSAHAERLAVAEDSEKNGQGMSVPGPQAAPAAGAFEQPSGVAGPSGNTVRPAGSYMPPTFPQSEPAANAEGFLAKAAEVLTKSEGGDALLAELKGMLDAEAQPGDEAEAKAAVIKDDGWPLDLATESFLNDTQAVRDEDDFGGDPNGLGRGKLVN